MNDQFTTDELIARGRAAHDAGAHDIALQVLEEAALREPGYADVHNLCGLAYVALNRPDDAIAAFERAIGLNAQYADAHLNRATALGRQGYPLEAERWRPPDPEVPAMEGDDRYPPMLSAHLANAHSDLGDVYASHGFLREATEQYSRACAIRPRYIDIRNKLARALIDLGILEAAVRELRHALAINPDYADARANLGLALFRSGDAAAAAAEWERCLAAQPDTDTVREFLAMLRDDDHPSNSGGVGQAREITHEHRHTEATSDAA